jgi:hypothetical protein
MKPFVAIAVVLALFAAACREEPMESEVADGGAHRKDVEQWQENRATKLKGEDNWLSLIGLFWLNDGNNVITLPKKDTPPIRLVRAGEIVTLEAASTMTIEGKPIGGPVTLQNDAAQNGPTIVQMGTVRFNVIKRGDRLGLRVKDSEAETRTNFQGLDYYPIDPKYRVEARFEAYHPPKQIPIDDVTGMRSVNISPGKLTFTLEGKEYSIDPVLETGSDELFIIFRDATSRDETYQAGRYLYAPMPKDGKTFIDFNKAYNPPCAFTPFATCPLPPPQNRLPVRIEAGEKRYAGAHA